MNFDGPEYKPERDKKRLTSQIKRIWDLMSDGRWRTYMEISRQIGAPQSSVSAQLRHLRKERFGSHTVERVYVGNGLFEYRVIPNAENPRLPV